MQDRHHLSWLPEAAFRASGEEKAPSEATSPHPKVDIWKAISGCVAHRNMSTLSIPMFNQVNPTYSVSVLKQKLTNQRPKGKSGIAWVNGAGATASVSAGSEDTEQAHHMLPVTCVGCDRFWRNGFVKGHQQSKFGSSFTIKGGTA